MTTKAEVKITPAKGRPMPSWGVKRPLSHVIAFPAQHVETFDPVGAGPVLSLVEGLVLPDQGRRPKMGAASSAPTKRNPKSATRILWDCFASWSRSASTSAGRSLPSAAAVPSKCRARSGHRAGI